MEGESGGQNCIDYVCLKYVGILSNRSNDNIVSTMTGLSRTEFIVHEVHTCTCTHILYI